MVLFYTLQDNFRETTEGLSTATVWLIRIVLLTLAIGLLMVIGNLAINGAPDQFSY